MYDRFRCPTCRDLLEVVPTAYGDRATCGRCEIRWTRLWEEAAWQPERR